MLESVEKLNNIAQFEGFSSKSKSQDSLFANVLQRAKSVPQVSSEHSPEDVFVPRYSEKSLEYAGMAQALQSVLGGVLPASKTSLNDAKNPDKFARTVVPVQHSKTA